MRDNDAAVMTEGANVKGVSRSTKSSSLRSHTMKGCGLRSTLSTMSRMEDDGMAGVVPDQGSAWLSWSGLDGTKSLGPGP